MLRLRLNWIENLTYFRAQIIDSSIDASLECAFHDLEEFKNRNGQQPSRLDEAKRKLYDQFSPKFKGLYEAMEVTARVAQITSQHK